MQVRYMQSNNNEINYLMKIDELNPNHIIAEKGMILKRISDGFIYGNEAYLGYTHYLNGEKLEEPLFELPEHFEEVINKDPYWELSDEDFNARVENGEIIFNEEMRLWEEPIIEDVEPEIIE